MKLSLSIFLIFLSLSSFGNETMLSDKGIDIFQEIISRWSNYNSSTFDTETLGNTVLAGRCYIKSQKTPYGTAIVFEQRKIDNGPIGTPNDIVSFGQFLWSESADHFDMLDYANFKYLTRSGSIREDFSEFGSDSQQVGLKDYSIRYLNGQYYAVRFYNDSSGNLDYATACYYFKNNN